MARAPGKKPTATEMEVLTPEESEPHKKQLVPRTKGLSMEWTAIRPREVIARLDDAKGEQPGTLLRCWQTIDYGPDGKPLAVKWYCMRGAHAIGVAPTLPEAKKLAQHGPVPPKPTKAELDAIYSEPPVPQRGKRGASPARVALEADGARAAGVKPQRPARVAKAGSGKNKYDDAQTILLVRKENPKKADAHRRYEFYRTCATVQAYAEAVGDRRKAEADIAWDSKQGWIKLGEVK